MLNTPCTLSCERSSRDSFGQASVTILIRLMPALAKSSTIAFQTLPTALALALALAPAPARSSPPALGS